jgi:branched-chain amino acid transport system substrate-binding protein
VSRYGKGRRSAFLGISALAVAALAAAGCSSSSSTSSTAPPATSGAATTPASTGSASPSSSSSQGGLGPAAVTDYLSYVGGKAGPANNSLPPVLIGFVNQQGGQQVIGADATTGSQMAVKYINTELGGVGGHPLQLVTCFIASAEEEGTGCAQKFLANKNIHVVSMGGVVIGDQSFFATLGGKLPVVSGVAALPIDGAQQNTAVLFGDGTHVLGPMGTYAKDVLHAKTAAVIYPNDPSTVPGAQAVEAGLKAAGVTVKMAPYAATQTDLTGVLTAAGATTADMVVPFVSAPTCVNIAKALIQLGITDTKKIVSAPLCLNGQVAAGLGGDFPKWTYSIASSLFGDPSDPGMPAYEAVAKKYSTPGDSPDPWNIVDFGQVLTIDKIFNQVGYANLSPATILAGLKAFKGPQALGAPQLACGKYQNAPGICNDRAQFFEYTGKNNWVRAALWLQPPGA